MKEVVVLVTGGGGFLGTHLTLLLSRFSELKLNNQVTIREIRVFDLKKPCFDFFFVSQPLARNISLSLKKHQTIGETDCKANISFIEGSILDNDKLLEAFQGVDVVFHCASLVDFGQHPRELINSVNITGTENVIRAARNTGCKYLIYTSTTEVASWKSRPNIEMREIDLQPENFTDYLGGNYGYSKRIAEDLVLSANSDVLKTCSIRPKGLYGEGDPYYLVNMLTALLDGQLSFLLGSSDTKLETIYVGNVAFAHIFLFCELIKNREGVEGEAFFVSCERKKNFYQFLCQFTDLVDKKLPSLYIPAKPLIAIAKIFDFLKSFLPQQQRAKLNKFSEQSIRSVVLTQTVCGDKLNALGFFPFFSEKESVKNTKAWLQQHWLPMRRQRERPSSSIPTVWNTVGLAVVGTVAYSLYHLL